MTRYYGFDANRVRGPPTACTLPRPGRFEFLSVDDLAGHLTEEECEGTLGLAEVIDGRGATTDVTPDQVRSLVARTDALVRKGRFGALAIVTDSDFAFGMARMYEILAEPLPVEIGVVRTLDDVTAWLSTAVGLVSE